MTDGSEVSRRRLSFSKFFSYVSVTKEYRDFDPLIKTEVPLTRKDETSLPEAYKHVPNVNAAALSLALEESDSSSKISGVVKGDSEVIGEKFWSLTVLQLFESSMCLSKTFGAFSDAQSNASLKSLFLL